MARWSGGAVCSGVTRGWVGCGFGIWFGGRGDMVLEA